MTIYPVLDAPPALADDYVSFLESKRVAAESFGFNASAMNPKLFDFQRAIVEWACRRGRAAVWADCGLGKGPISMEWAQQVSRHTDRPVLILAPLAVAQQFQREAVKFGYELALCRSQADVQLGINVANYEMLQHFEASTFTGVVLDESAILKNFSGVMKKRLVETFANTPYRLCCTATPAPNDHMELGNHSEFLGIMRSGEMLMRWFINDTMAMGQYRLKGHAERDFYDWLASWAVSLRRPSDLGFSDDGFILPPLEMHQISVAVDQTEAAGDQLFRLPTLSATTMHQEMRLTAPDRAERAATLVNGSDEPWLLWCNTNYEADELIRRIPDAVEVRGSESVDTKEAKIAQFVAGTARVLISKPSICGHGLNFQFCRNVAFVGLSYSFEALYQAVRRSYRYGQTQPVHCYLITADTEGAILTTLHEKMEAHNRMMDAMTASTRRLSLDDHLKLRAVPNIERVTGDGYDLLHGDCVRAVSEMPDNSVHFSIHSPPFSSLYTYSDAMEDMGNSASDEEFFAHYGYLIPELYRVTIPGRLAAVHCKQLVNYKGRDGMAGLRDFRGDIIRAFTEHGWAYHSEVCIWKDPVIEMQRTKAHGLLYKQIRADSTFSRQGMAEYLLLFRRWPDTEEQEALVEAVTHTKDDFPLDVWQRYASPIWMDIRQTRVLNVQSAREDRDSKHICPLQLDVIERALELWTNPGDTVLDPFAGICSTGYEALKLGRRFLGVELKDSYVQAGIKYLELAIEEARTPDLFSAVGLSLESA